MQTKTRSKKPKYPEWTPEWVKLCFRIGYRLSLIFLVIFTLIAIFYWVLARQYDLDEIAKKSETYLTYYDDGQEISAARNQSDIITYDDLPDHAIKALQAREDTRFFTHCGIDFKGLARATVKNIISLSYKEGASTISMQLVKNAYDNKSKSIHRKLLEIAITLRMEGQYDKKEILTHYLNHIYFGAGCHGIEEAAQTYYGIPTKQLTLAQSALLMGIIRAPHDFSPFNPDNGLENATEQRDQVLDRMLHLQYINSTQHQEAKTAPLNLVAKNKRSPNKSFANYAVRSIERHRQQIIDSQQLIESGLRIHSTINRNTLNQVTLDLKQALPPEKNDSKNPLQVATVILENKTGAVKAIIGGRNYLKSPYNRALDSKLELGSAFHPFVYLAAYERGNIPLRNQPIVTGNQIGYSTMLKFCNRFGIVNKPAKNPADLYRGNIYASPLQLASAYSILKTHGNRVESFFIKSIKDKKNKELFTHQLYQKPVAKAGNATSTFHIISNKKSSTSFISYAYKHAWIIAISDQYTAVTWLGHDKPANITDKESICKKIQLKMKTWVNK